jgi:hypothetical protein
MIKKAADRSVIKKKPIKGHPAQVWCINAGKKDATLQGKKREKQQVWRGRGVKGIIDKHRFIRW